MRRSSRLPRGRATATTRRRPKLLETLDALGRIVPNLRERLLISDADFAAFSPDGSRIVTASSDKTARVWDAATGKAIAVLSGHRGPRRFRRLQPRRVAHRHGVSDKTARVWDAATGKAIAVLSGHEGEVTSAAFSPDGSRIVTASTTRPRASGTPRPARRSSSSAATRSRSIPPPSAPTGRASSRRLRTRPRASGTPRPARRSPSSAATRARSIPPPSAPTGRASSRRRRTRPRASGTPRPAKRSPSSAATRTGQFRRLQPRRVAHRHGV